MVKSEYITIPQLAKLLGLSRIEVYRKVKKGQIKAQKIGKSYIIDDSELQHVLGQKVSEKDKEQIKKAVKKTVKDYGEVLKKLGKE